MPSRAYLGRFNFKGNDQQKRVGNLSGGERGRLHLAKTLAQGGNVLLLDEPSNDLDVETLRALEDALLEFAGCVMVISHDRWFLDRIATHILAARATRSGSSSTATTRNTRPTRRSAWARRAPGRTGCASRRCTSLIRRRRRRHPTARRLPGWAFGGAAHARCGFSCDHCSDEPTLDVLDSRHAARAGGPAGARRLRHRARRRSGPGRHHWRQRAASGCALPPKRPAAASAPNAGASAPAAARPAAAPAAGTPPPFATVIKDAKPVHGLITRLAEGREGLARAEARGLQARPSSCAQVRAAASARAGFFGGLMAGRWAGPVAARRCVRVPARAQPGAAARAQHRLRGRGRERPTARAVEAALLAQPARQRAGGQPAAPRAQDSCWSRPTRCSSTTCWASASALQRTYRQGYALDGRNSAITAVRGKPDAAGFRDAERTTPPAASRCRSPARRPARRRRPCPLAARCAQHVHRRCTTRCRPAARRSRWPARKADPRVGHFTTARQRLQRRPRAHAAAALRQPLAPREEGPGRRAVGAGQADHLLARPQHPAEVPRRRSPPASLEWNKAFEKIGFKDAIVVKVQPDDADFDTLDVGVASIRWMTNAQPGLRRHRPEPRRPAHRRDPRRRHRLREPVARAPCARCARRSWRPGRVDWPR